MSLSPLTEMSDFAVRLRAAPSLVSEQAFIKSIQVFFLNTLHKPFSISQSPSMSELNQEIMAEIFIYLDNHISLTGKSQLALFLGYFKKESALISDGCLHCISELGKSEEYSASLLARAVKEGQKFLKTETTSKTFTLKCLEFPSKVEKIGKILASKMLDKEWEYLICSREYEIENAFILPFDEVYIAIKCFDSRLTIMQGPANEIDNLCYIECDREAVSEGSIFIIENYLFCIAKLRPESIDIECFSLEYYEKIETIYFDTAGFIGFDDINGLRLGGLHKKQLQVYFTDNTWYLSNNRPDKKMYKALHNKFSMNFNESMHASIDKTRALIIRNIKLEVIIRELI
jgi:hypothetical protein